MCGRYASFRQAQDLADIFDVAVVAEDAAELPPSWNVAPTDGARVVLERTVQPEPEEHAAPGTRAAEAPAPGASAEAVRREMHLARWGLVPHWAQDLSAGAKMINARMESVGSKSAFATPLRTKRCLVVADGYYEWQKPAAGAGHAAKKTPFFIRPADGSPLAFAGLYSWWRRPGDPAAPWLLTCTILTTAAVGPMGELHDRVPVILSRSHVDPWLDRSVTNADEALAVARQPGPELTWYEVSTQVNAVRNDGPELVAAVAP
ncbi:SOS response-associated peptidase [Georgenia yuyongxinii]|uniref:Abasic site processing protein n=1 Tax=Georgenia yuyongxinii TaxID=2589797 RepID=A0A5B8C5N5_9MICO|nr:SOS response-associated peptidase [Georgenia yuyongxinii]QDC25380.1 SOS response-associated peptidase [Georgenia yuyongxinii]